MTRKLPAALMGQTDEKTETTDPQLIHLLRHVKRFLSHAVSVPEGYIELLRSSAQRPSEDALPRLMPFDLGKLKEDAEALSLSEGAVTASQLRQILRWMEAQDLFAARRTFRVSGEDIVPSPVGDIRELQDFYGYKAVRRYFGRHFESFSEGQRVQPLLLSGLPGLGKTHLTIAFIVRLPFLVAPLFGRPAAGRSNCEPKGAPAA
jgi:predicted AAA+ superfamily ATPase